MKKYYSNPHPGIKVGSIFSSVLSLFAISFATIYYWKRITDSELTLLFILLGIWNIISLLSLWGYLGSMNRFWLIDSHSISCYNFRKKKVIDFPLKDIASINYFKNNKEAVHYWEGLSIPDRKWGYNLEDQFVIELKEDTYNHYMANYSKFNYIRVKKSKEFLRRLKETTNIPIAL